MMAPASDVGASPKGVTPLLMPGSVSLSVVIMWGLAAATNFAGQNIFVGPATEQRTEDEDIIAVLEADGESRRHQAVAGHVLVGGDALDGTQLCRS